MRLPLQAAVAMLLAAARWPAPANAAAQDLRGTAGSLFVDGTLEGYGFELAEVFSADVSGQKGARASRSAIRS